MAIADIVFVYSVFVELLFTKDQIDCRLECYGNEVDMSTFAFCNAAQRLSMNFDKCSLLVRNTWLLFPSLRIILMLTAPFFAMLLRSE